MALREFKEFLLRGSVVDLAVGIVIGAAFTAVVNAFVADFMTPLIAAIGGKPDFRALNFTVNGSIFRYGAFVNEVISFLIVAAVIFYAVILPINALSRRSRSEPPADPTLRDCPECLSAIPVRASRCAFCSSAVAPQVAS